jgi:3-oxoacyl-[acyl-carrier protein] reductase
VADVTNWDAVGDMVGSIEAEFGAVDVLVNNAGVPLVGAGLTPFETSSPEDWQPWLAISLYGVMYATRAVLPAMLAKGWGRVVTVVSDAGRVGEAGLTAYATAKAGAAGFTRSVAREVGSRGVTCNSVALGTIKHGPHAEFLTGDFEKKLLKRYMVDRLGTPEDPAALISFLAGDDAGWITGQTYPINGGFSVTQ